MKRIIYDCEDCAFVISFKENEREGVFEQSFLYPDQFRCPECKGHYLIRKERNELK